MSQELLSIITIDVQDEFNKFPEPLKSHIKKVANEAMTQGIITAGSNVQDTINFIASMLLSSSIVIALMDEDEVDLLGDQIVDILDAEPSEYSH